MNLSSAQQTSFRNWLLANASGLSDLDAANLANAVASPNYWVWRTSVSRADVYATTSDLPSNWVWSTYKAQTVTEQNAWTQMFMGDQCDFSRLNNRVGVDDIFGGNANGNAQRSHVFAVGRRRATNFEKLFVTASATQGGKVTGNDGVTGNRGLTSNPDTLGVDASGQVIEQPVSSQLVAEIRG